MPRAYLALGSNLGDRLAHLQAAVDSLARVVAVSACSSVYETDPVGPDQPDYLNAVVAVDTDLDARGLLALAQGLEVEAERVREQRFGPRTLDVDVIWIDGVEIDEADLTVPHPRASERGFVLAPLSDVAPELVDDAGPWAGVRPTDHALSVTQIP